MPGGNERSGPALRRAGRLVPGGAGLGPGRAAQARLLQLLWPSLTENCAAAQSHAGECHQPPALGRGLPVVPEGVASMAGVPGGRGEE